MGELSTWQAGLNQAEKQTLSLYALTINTTVDETYTTVKRAKIAIGHQLNKARDVLKSDQKFGEWARIKTPFSASQHWGPLMKIAAAEANGILTDEMIDNSSPAVLAKILRLPEPTRDELLEKVASGEQVKRDQVPTVAQAEAGEVPLVSEVPIEPEAKEEAPVTAETTSRPSVDTMNEAKATKKNQDDRQALRVAGVDEWREIIDMKFEYRLDAVADLRASITDLEAALATLGLDVDPQNLPNEQTLSIIEEGLRQEEADSPIERIALQSAVQTINEAREEW